MKKNYEFINLRFIFEKINLVKHENIACELIMSKKDYEKGIAVLKKTEELDELNNEGAFAKYLEAAEILMNFAKRTKDLKLRNDIIGRLDYIVSRSRKLRGIPEGYEGIGGFYKFERVENIDPLKILKIRLAKGEISKEEYEALKRTLEE